jgi:hypothetical protein
MTEVKPEIDDEHSKTADGETKSEYKGKLAVDPDYKGEKLPDELKEGPVTNRHCTDILCCLIFI